MVSSIVIPTAKLFEFVETFHDLCSLSVKLLENHIDNIMKFSINCYKSFIVIQYYMSRFSRIPESHNPTKHSWLFLVVSDAIQMILLNYPFYEMLF